MILGPFALFLILFFCSRLFRKMLAGLVILFVAAILLFNCTH
jgi:hypothetical protein